MTAVMNRSPINFQSSIIHVCCEKLRQRGVALSEHYILIHIDEPHPIVISSMITQAQPGSNGSNAFKARPGVIRVGDKTSFDEVLNLIPHYSNLASQTFDMVDDVHPLHALQAVEDVGFRPGRVLLFSWM